MVSSVFVVVSAELESEYGVELARARSDHDDGDLRFLAQGATDIKPRHARQHDVEEHEVGIARAAELECLLTIGGDDRGKPLALEAQHQCLDETRLVVGDQDRTQGGTPLTSCHREVAPVGG